MADPVIEPVIAPAPAPAAPVPAPEPVAAAVPVAAAPEPAPTPAAEVPAVDAKPNAHAEASLLEGAKAPTGDVAAAGDAKPGETKPVEAAKPAEVAKPAEAAKSGETKPAEGAQPVVEVAPVYEFKLPEGIKAAPEQLSAYTEVLKTNGIKPEIGQALLDQHTTAMQQYAEHLLAEQHRVFADTRKQWRDAVTADAQIGGSGHQTAMQAIARMRDLLVPETERSEFNEFLRVTGAGDHPQFLKLLHVASRYLDEPPAPARAGEPTASNGQKPGRGRGLKGIYQDNAAKRATS